MAFNFTLNLTSGTGLMGDKCTSWCQYQIEMTQYLNDYAGLILIFISICSLLIYLFLSTIYGRETQEFIYFSIYLLLGFLILKVFQL